jgi:hypothetical protein
MRVYMIEDGIDKQKWFLLMLRKANVLAADVGLGVSFESGFGDDAFRSSQICSRTPSHLMESLRAPDAIYLVDLKLLESPEDRGGLLVLMQEAPEVWAQRAARKYLQLAPEPTVDTALGQTLSGLASTAEQYALSTLLLLAAKELGRPVLFVSTQGSWGDVTNIKEAGLATVPSEAFPSTDPELCEEQKKQAYILNWAKRIIAMVNPLDRLRVVSANWFKLGVETGWQSTATDGLPHDPDPEWQRLTLAEHRECVGQAFPWSPESWWRNTKLAEALHRCLKASVGYHAQWMGEDPRYGLCLGGAYLLFLLAIAQKFPESVYEFLVVDWNAFTFSVNDYMRPIPFLPSQESEDADRSVRTLYELFCTILPLKDRPEQLAVAGIEGPFNGQAYFRLKLKWSVEQIAECTATINSSIEDAFTKDYLTLPRGKTVGAFLRFLICSQSRRVGMGAIGSIALDKDGWLRVGR